jgi:hypothetical protein
MAENISRHIAATMARARYEEIKRDYIMEVSLPSSMLLRLKHYPTSLLLRPPQSFFRCVRARCTSLTLLGDQMATNIQRVWRGHGPRRLMSTFAFPGHSRAATKLSSVYRGHYARVRVRLGYNPKCEAAAAVLQKAYRSSVTRDILKVLRSVRCVPLSMALAGIAMYPSPRLLIEPDVAAMRALYLRTGELCTSFLNQTDLWVRRAFRYHAMPPPPLTKILPLSHPALLWCSAPSPAQISATFASRTFVVLWALRYDEMLQVSAGRERGLGEEISSSRDGLCSGRCRSDDGALPGVCGTSAVFHTGEGLERQVRRTILLFPPTATKQPADGRNWKK